MPPRLSQEQSLLHEQGPAEGGRSRERSTGMTDREQAKQALAEFIHARQRHSGPRDPSQILITDFLADYAQEHAAETAAPWRIASAVKPLVEFWHEPYKSKHSRWM